jgi:hypothetical protein
MLVHIYGNSVRIGIHDADHYGHHYGANRIHIDRRCEKRNLLALRIINNAKIVDFHGWGELVVELDDEDYEMLNLLSKVDFRSVKLDDLRDLRKVKELLQLYAIASSLRK